MSAPSRPGSRKQPSSFHHPVVVVGLGLIVIQVLVRSIALFHGWFYADDFEFLQDASGRPLTLGYLLTPHDSQLMPAGVFWVWIVAQSAPFNWALAATVIVVLQLFASLACWLMLCQVFGVRWWCLGLLTLYLFSTMTLTAFMWWSAAINQVPVQLACFLALAAHVQFLREKRMRYAFLTAAALVLGLLFYVKALLITLPVLALTFFYFTDREATPAKRVRQLVLDYWRAWVLYGAVVIGYLAYYVGHVPNPISADNVVPYGQLFDTMVRISLGPVTLGGPWWWSNTNPPVGLVATPEWAVTLVWVVIGIAVALRWRSQKIDWRALLVMGPYLVLSAVLVARGRASFFGVVAGRELRYLADFTPVLVIGIGLLVWGRQGIRTRPPHSTVTTLPAATRAGLGSAVIALVLVVGTVVSTLTYARFWSAPFPAKSFTQNVIGESDSRQLRIADVPVPEPVMSGVTYPANLPSHLFSPLGKDRVRATTLGTDLDVLSSSGEAVAATVVGTSSAAGPQPDCGYPIRGGASTLKMLGAQPNAGWWLEMSYLAGDDGTVELVIDGHRRVAPVRKGLHRLFMKGDGAATAVSIRSLSDQVGLCVDRVAIGDIMAVEQP